MAKVIGITGLKRHGKGEVGNAIERLVPGTVQVGFADKLKISMMRSLGFDRPEPELIALADEAKVNWSISIRKPIKAEMPTAGWWDNTVAEFHTLSGRELLQWFGTEGGRETFGDSFWIDQVLPNPLARNTVLGDEIGYRYNNAPVVAITDVRFDNEAQRIKDVGGEVWEVVRPELVDASADTHASEAGVDPALIDTVIINDADLDTLQWRVEQALELGGLL